MSDSNWRNLLLIVRRALRQPFAVVTLIVGALWSMALLSGWPVTAAVAIVAVYTAIKLRDDAFIRTALHEASGRQREADLVTRTFRVEELDVDSRVRMKAIVRLQSEIAEDVANSPVDEVAAGLSDTVEHAAAIVDRGMAMAQKRRELQRYLNKTDFDSIQARITKLEAKLQSESDPARRSELEMSLAAKRQELGDYQAIQHASARVLEQLDGIQYAFEGLRARLVRIKSSDIAEWTAANEELKTELGGLTTAVDTVERSVEEALSVGGSPGS